MKKFTLSAIALAGVSLLALGAGTAQAQFVNPGVKTGDFTGWTLSGNSGFISITTRPTPATLLPLSARSEA